MQNQSTRFGQYSVEFEQCCKVFDISPEPDSICSQQKNSSDLVGGHYIFPNGFHFTEPTVPSEYPNTGCEVPKHGVRRTILPICTPFFIRLRLKYVDQVWGMTGDVPYEYPTTRYVYPTPGYGYPGYKKSCSMLFVMCFSGKWDEQIVEIEDI